MKAFIVKNRKYIIGALVLVGIWYLWGSSGDDGVTYITEPIETQDIKREISLTGSIQSLQEVNIQTTLSEIVREIPVEVGDEVKKGDILVVLDSRQLDVLMQQAEASVLSAQAQVDLLLEGASNEDRALSNQEIISAQSVYANTEKILEQVEQINTKTYAQAEIDLRLAQQEYQTALTRYNNTKNSVVDDSVTSEKAVIDAYDTAKTAFDNAWVKALDTRSKANSILKRDTQYAEYNQYGSAQFGARSQVLRSRVGFAYDSYKNSLDIFKGQVLPYVAYWELDEQVEADLRKMMTLLTEAQNLIEGVLTVLDYTQVQTFLDSNAIGEIRSLMLAFSSDLNTRYSALQTAIQGIENAKLNDKSIDGRSNLSLDDAKAALDRARINKDRAEKNLQTLAVENGRKIVEIENELDRTQQSINAARKNYARTVADPRSVDLAGPEASLKQAQSRLAQAQLDLDNATVLSPIDGIVTQIYTEIGERVTPNTPLVRVIDPALEMIANVSETDIGELKIDQGARVTFDAFSPRDVVTARVVDIDPAETIIQGVIYYQVTFDFEAGDLSLRSGMTANIDLLVAEKQDILAVDSQAVNYEEGKAYVEIYNEEMEEPEQRFIEIGMEGDRYYEIVSGLELGEFVVLYKEE